jgi:Mg-chelatase subunit ChlD
MEDPVIDHEGNTYERKAIETWIEKNPTSPFTKSPLTLADLHPNRALRDCIDLYRKTGTKPVKSQEVDIVPIFALPPPTSLPLFAETPGGVKLTAEVDANGLLLISADPPLEGDRVPSDICCVIDISGSMNAEATLKSTDGDVEAYGLSILDVVKHAMKTIIEVLGPDDRLSIVTFSDAATEELPLSEMTPTGKQSAITKLESFKPLTSTNLWAGLNLGLDILKTGKKANRLAALYILTDGEPNIPPPRGELAMLEQYNSKHGLPCSVSTFGFGYKLNSHLLNSLAIEGNGSYAFIPDSSLTGTVFVNALSNTLSTFATDMVISFEPLNAATKILGDFPIKNGKKIHMGSLKYGQRKDLVIQLQNKELPNRVSLEYSRTLTSEKEKCSLSQFTPTDLLHPTIHQYRLLLTEKFKNGLQPPIDNIKQLIQEIQNSPCSNDPFAQDLVKDISGQIMEGLEAAAWDKWGRHFIPSLCRAHLLQQCNNFKDPGVQHYGGKLFRVIRESAEELFVKLPAPKPSRVIPPKPTPSSSSSLVKTTISGKTFKPQSNPKPVKMQAYYNHSGGCIGSEGNVLMQDNSYRKVKDIRKGDYIQLPNGESTPVLCVCKTTLNPRDKAPLVLLESGLVITPWHPVLYKNEWRFPCHIGELWNTSFSSQDVFNFVLEKGHIMTVNGIDCVTLGHGFTQDVVKHQYFGTEEVIKDLKCMPGWETGYIDLNEISTRRDSETGLVAGYLLN